MKGQTAPPSLARGIVDLLGRRPELRDVAGLAASIDENVRAGA